jgi:hypothetical protein
MNDERVLGVVSGKTEDELIEVVLDCEEGGSGCLQLRSRRWGSGIGWYTQKSLEIDPSQADRLIQILQRAGRRSEAPSETALRHNVVPFMRRYGT